MCRCSCGAVVSRGRSFVDNVHQLRWMAAGGAREMNALLPHEVRQRGGHTSGTRAAESGRHRQSRAASLTPALVLRLSGPNTSDHFLSREPLKVRQHLRLDFVPLENDSFKKLPRRRLKQLYRFTLERRTRIE